MNYIDPTFLGVHSLKLNTRAEVTDTIVWTMIKEGDDSTFITFSSNSTNITLSQFSYYQELALDLNTEGITLDNETWYVLKATVGSNVVYRGRVLATDKDITSYSINTNKYTENPNNNTYIILE
jgi:hypothetical protein